MASDISPLGKVALGSIRFYQKFISPALGPHCRFYPSYSQYTFEAIKEWGVIKGTFMGAKRICRCHPLNDGGFDPVPKKTNQSL